MKYILEFSEESKTDIQRLKKSGSKILLKKLTALLEELTNHPKTGTGKPEQLKHYETPTWSRRISDKHRLVYRIEEHKITVLVLSAWGHYDDSSVGMVDSSTAQNFLHLFPFRQFVYYFI